MSEVELIFKSMSSSEQESIEQLEILINESIQQYETIRVTRGRVYYKDPQGQQFSVENPAGKEHMYGGNYGRIMNGGGIVCEKFNLKHVIDFAVLVSFLSLIVPGFTFPLLGGLIGKLLSVALSSLGIAKNKLQTLKDNILYVIERHRLNNEKILSELSSFIEKLGNTREGKKISDIMKFSIVPNVKSMLSSVITSLTGLSSPIMFGLKMMFNGALTAYNAISDYYESSAIKLFTDFFSAQYTSLRLSLCDSIDNVVISMIGDEKLKMGITNVFNSVYSETEELYRKSQSDLIELQKSKQQLETEMQTGRLSLAKMESALSKIKDPVLLQKLQESIVRGQLYRKSISDQINSLEERIKTLDVLIKDETENTAENKERLDQLKKAVNEMNTTLVDDISDIQQEEDIIPNQLSLVQGPQSAGKNNRLKLRKKNKGKHGGSYKIKRTSKNHKSKKGGKKHMATHKKYKK